MRNVFHFSPLWNTEAWGQILSCYQGRWLHWLQVNSQFSKRCRPGWELCSPCLSFQTAFEALNKSKSSSHTALLPAFLGAPLLVWAVWHTNSEGQINEFLFLKVSGKLLVAHVRSHVRKLHRLRSWGTGEYFIFEGHIFSEAESECDLLLKKTEMEKWKYAPVLVANTFRSPATDVWLPRLALAFEQCPQVASRSRSWSSGYRAIVSVPVSQCPTTPQ